MFGAQILTKCEKYLELPMVGGKSKVGMLKALQERIAKGNEVEREVHF